MADAAVLSVALERLAAILEDKIRGEVSLVRGVKKEVVNLANKLRTFRNVLGDAERRGVKDASVRDWLKKLEATAYEMEDILDEWNYYAIDASLKEKEKEKEKEKVRCSCIPSSCLCFKKLYVRRDTAKKIQNVKASLEEILKEKHELNLVISTLPETDCNPQFGTTSAIDEEKVEGKGVERNKNDIVKKLMMDGDSQQIVSIVGMGGIGKTTLAQLVYNDSRVKDCFDITIWVCVSDPFDVARIASEIIEKVEKKGPPNTNVLDVLLEKLRDCISGKKFLLVLDDVWNEDCHKWEPLRVSLNNGAASRKILVTTRNERVATIMGTSEEEIYRPEQLEYKECWSLLCRIALPRRSKEECGVYEEIGKKILSRCKGLPLAVNVVGSVLLFKNSLEEWERVGDSEIWQMDVAEIDLYPHLLLSYNELPPKLKLCFSYCAVYPKDTQIEVEILIQHWMAQGYLGSIPRAEHVGRDYFNNLARRSLFQDFEKYDPNEQISSCKMHDIVHDFAQYLRKTNRVEASGEIKGTCQVCNHVQAYRTLLWDKQSPLAFCDCLTSLRVYGYTNGFPQGVEKLIHLRWLDLSRTRLSKEEMKTICKLYYLQTLLLSECSLEEIPHEIGNLVKLRHLDLSENEGLKLLPKSIYSLVKLQTLLLSNCSLKEIPHEIGNLVKLRHLNLRGNFELKELPESICKLVELQTLTMEDCIDCRLHEGFGKLSDIQALDCFYGGSGFNRLGLLKNFNCLKGDLELFISVSSNITKELVEDAREAELKEKIHLHTLEFKFMIKRRNDDVGEGSSSSSSSLSLPSLWVDLIEALEPNHNLQSVLIRDYRGWRLPHWISSPLNQVREIRLWECREVSSLPPMGKLPNLEKLVIVGMHQLKVLGVEWLGIRGGREGEVMLDIQSSSSLVAFPKLQTLVFFVCSNWVEWEDITAEEEESSSAVSVMPRLTHLYLWDCDALKMLPHHLLRKASSLQSLDIRGSTALEECYGEKDGSPWRSISRNNPQLKLGDCNLDSD